MTIVMAVIILALAFMRVPIGIAFGLGAMGALLWSGSFPLVLAPIQVFSGLNSFVLVAVPLFVLVGVLMTQNRIADDIFRFSKSLVSYLPGSLGHVNIISSLIFGGISGSAAADAGGIGRAFIATQLKYGYPMGYVAALTAASAILSSLIPPSLMAVLYGVAANASIGKVMLAGLGPGIVFCLMMMVYNHVVCVRMKWDPPTGFSIREVGSSLKSASVSLMIPVILIGGIVGGIFTPTEAAAAAVLFVFAADLVIYRQLDVATVKHTFLTTVRISGSVLLILATASLVTFVMTVDGVPQALTRTLSSLTTDRTIILILINVILFVAGMFIDPVAGIVLFVPLLLPTAKLIGVDNVHFGIIVMVNLACGLLTPPIGSVLFITSAVTRFPVAKLVVELLPFYAMLIIMMALVSFVPAISLWLPNMLMSD
jgi:tripartite ATP-independent transporter DctM subunit